MFEKGDEVKLKGNGMPVCPMLVTDEDAGRVCCIWLDRDLRVQGYYFPPELLEKA